MRSHIRSGLLLSISALTLAACSGGQHTGLGAGKSAAPLPPESITQNTLTESDTLTPVSLSADSAAPASATPPLSAPPETVISGAPVEDRIAKLEETVNSLRRDYDRIMPAFASLNTTNERIQTLLDEIEQQAPGRVVSSQSEAIAPTSVQKTVETTTEVVAPSEDVLAAMDKMAAPSGPVVETKTAITTTTASTPAATAAAPAKPSALPAITETVKGVRIGEHNNKTRVVIDLGGNMKPDAAFDLDNNEKLLLVDLPGTAWVGSKTGAPKNSTFVSGWNVQDGASGGSTLAIQLKKGAKILSTEYLKAGGKDGARLVIDIGPSV